MTRPSQTTIARRSNASMMRHPIAEAKRKAAFLELERGGGSPAARLEYLNQSISSCTVWFDIHRRQVADEEERLSDLQSQLAALMAAHPELREPTEEEQ